MLYSFLFVNNTPDTLEVTMNGTTFDSSSHDSFTVSIAPYSKSEPHWLHKVDAVLGQISNKSKNWHNALPVLFTDSTHPIRRTRLELHNTYEAFQSTKLYEIPGYYEKAEQNCLFMFAPVISPSRWMGQLNVTPTTTLADITIPGTHDSATWKGNGNDRCQSLTIAQQLDIGIRWFDLRLAINASDLAVYHSNDAQNISLLADILPAIGSFLLNNATETVILSIQHEGVDYNPGDYTFDDLFKNVLLQIIPPNMIYYGSGIPLLSDVKGKLVLIRRDPNPGFGIDAKGWPDGRDTATGMGACDNGLLYIQDKFQWIAPMGNDAKIQAKFDTVRQLIENANSRTTREWFINFTSASIAPIFTPIEFAKGVNGLLFDFLVTAQSPMHIGTMPMDFPELGPFSDPGSVEFAPDTLTKLLISMNKLTV